jgi:hypothetical protein
MAALISALEAIGLSGGCSLHRGDDEPNQRVLGCLGWPSKKRIDGGLVIVPNFDEALRDLVRMCATRYVGLDAFAASSRWTQAPLPIGQQPAVLG